MDKDQLKYIKDSMLNHEEYIDKDVLWESLGIQEEKKRRIIPIWWLGSIVAIASLVVLSITLWPSSDLQDLMVDIQSIYDDSQSTKIEDSAVPTNQSNLSKVPEISDQNTTNDMVDERQSTIQTSALNKEHNNQVSSAVITSSGQNPNGQISSTVNEISNTIEDQITSTEYTVTSTNIRLEKEGPVALNTPEITSISTYSLEEIDFIPRLSNTLLPLQKDKPVIGILPTLINPVDLINPSKWSWNIGSEIGYFNIENSLESDDYSSLLDYRIQSQKNLEQIGINAGFRYQLSPRLYLSTGIGYQRLTQQLNYQNTSLRNVSDTRVTAINVALKGDTTILASGTVMGTAEDITYYNTYNEFHLINIPLQIGYQRAIGKLSYFIEGGLKLNVSHTFSGRTFNEVNGIATETDEYRSALGLGLTLGLGLKYHSSERTSFYLNPNYTRWVSPMSINGATITQRLSATSLQVGAEFAF